MMHVATKSSATKACLVKYLHPEAPQPLFLLVTPIITFSYVLPEFYDREVSGKCDHTVNVALHLVFPLNRSW